MGLAIQEGGGQLGNQAQEAPEPELHRISDILLLGLATQEGARQLGNQAQDAAAVAEIHWTQTSPRARIYAILWGVAAPRAVDYRGGPAERVECDRLGRDSRPESSGN